MPVWLEISLGVLALAISTTPGVIALVTALISFGRLHQQVTSQGEILKAVPGMAVDIAYLRGRLEGSDVERLSTITTTTRRRKIALAAHNGGISP